MNTGMSTIRTDSTTLNRFQQIQFEAESQAKEAIELVKSGKIEDDEALVQAKEKTMLGTVNYLRLLTEANCGVLDAVDRNAYTAFEGLRRRLEQQLDQLCELNLFDSDVFKPFSSISNPSTFFEHPAEPVTELLKHPLVKEAFEDDDTTLDRYLPPVLDRPSSPPHSAQNGGFTSASGRPLFPGNGNPTISQKNLHPNIVRSPPTSSSSSSSATYPGGASSITSRPLGVRQGRNVFYGRKRNEDEEEDTSQSADRRAEGNFISARDQKAIDDAKKGNRPGATNTGGTGAPAKRPAGGLSKSTPAKRICNITKKDDEKDKKPPEDRDPIFEDERIRGMDEELIERILSEIVDNSAPVTWDDIAGLQHAKSTINEIVVYPMRRPDLFKGLRAPPKGLLLFGPPGTGKTMIGKALASQAGATFFSISASSLTSKWVGEGEKMVRALFLVARIKQPSVIFIDEIDSLLTMRTEGDYEASRRIKTEFLVQFDGVGSEKEGQRESLLVVGATNRPQELDEAARRRFTKRLYIPLPGLEARKYQVLHLLRHNKHSLSDSELDELCKKTKGYSGADIRSLCSEAAMGPLRLGLGRNLDSLDAEEVRPINFSDFQSALESVPSSVGPSELVAYVNWNGLYGTKAGPDGSTIDDD